MRHRTRQDGMTRWQPGELIVWFAIAIPVVQWLRIKSGTESYTATYTSLTLWTVLGLALVACWVLREDRWLGAFLLWGDAQILRFQTTEVVETALFVTFGAVALVSVRRLDARRREIAGLALVAAGVVQAFLAIAELIWFPLAGVPAAPFGSLGNSNFLGVYLAVLAPLAPPVLLPVLLLGLLASKCLVGVVAAAIGLAVRYADRLWLWLAGGAAGFAAVVGLKQGGAFGGLAARLTVWQFTLEHVSEWHAWLVGHGLGRWKVLVPFWQARDGQPQAAWFIEAHNDWLQLLFEGGLLGLVLVIGWLVAHREMFAGPYGGAVAAIGVAALGIFSFHLVTVGLLCVVVLGLATGAESDGHKGAAR